MKILVTGGYGFIGSNFILNTITSDKTIYNVDKLTYASNKHNLSSIEKLPNYGFFNIDICDKTAISRLIMDYKPDILFHFAAESHVDRSIHSPDHFINTNIVGTASLLNASLKLFNKKNDFKFIHVSTDEVFGSLDKNGLFDENSKYNPNSPYSASKASSDHLVRSWNKTYGLPAIITNCTNNYGPYQFPEKLIPLLITNCIDKKTLPIFGKGNNIRDWIFVEDHCDAIDLISKSGIIGESYCIGSSNEKTNIEIVEKICSIFDELSPRPSGKQYSDLIRFVDDRPGHDYRYAVDTAKMRKEFNWTPKKDFVDGLKETVMWYIKNESWWRSIKK